MKLAFWELSQKILFLHVLKGERANVKSFHTSFRSGIYEANKNQNDFYDFHSSIRPQMGTSCHKLVNREIAVRQMNFIPLLNFKKIFSQICLQKKEITEI